MVVPTLVTTPPLLLASPPLLLASPLSWPVLAAALVSPASALPLPVGSPPPLLPASLALAVVTVVTEVATVGLLPCEAELLFESPPSAQARVRSGAARRKGRRATSDMRSDSSTAHTSGAGLLSTGSRVRRGGEEA